MFAKSRIKLISILIFSIWCDAASSGQKESPEDFIKNIEGVYKNRFTNSLVDGEKYQSEDIVEIVKYSPDAIYFRAELKFYNGHSCGIAGIAKYSEGEFVYKEKVPDDKSQACTLRIGVDKGDLKLSDTKENNSDSTCSSYCGARGSLGNYKISTNKKRKIRYMPIILKSREYLYAVDQYSKTSDGK